MTRSILRLNYDNDAEPVTINLSYYDANLLIGFMEHFKNHITETGVVNQAIDRITKKINTSITNIT